MGAVNTTYTFTATDTITSTKMNNIIDQTTIEPDAIIGTTLEVTSGKLKVRSQGITSNELANGCVTSNAILDGTITDIDINASAAISPSKLGSGALTSTATVTTSNIVDASITAPKLNGAQTGTAPIYGARAWVSFNGTTSGIFAGGGSTVTRVAGSTLCTVTTASPHGMVTNNRVYAATGVVAGIYTITKLTDTTFTFNTAATTALTSVSITFSVRSINGAGNINSIAYAGTGIYYINMSTELSSSNYAISWAGTSTGVTGLTYSSVLFTGNKNTSSFSATFTGADGDANQNQSIVDFVVFQ